MTWHPGAAWLLDKPSLAMLSGKCGPRVPQHGRINFQTSMIVAYLPVGYTCAGLYAAELRPSSSYYKTCLRKTSFPTSPPGKTSDALPGHPSVMELTRTQFGFWPLFNNSLTLSIPAGSNISSLYSTVVGFQTTCGSSRTQTISIKRLLHVEFCRPFIYP